MDREQRLALIRPKLAQGQIPLVLSRGYHQNAVEVGIVSIKARHEPTGRNECRAHWRACESSI